MNGVSTFIKNLSNVFVPEKLELLPTDILENQKSKGFFATLLEPEELTDLTEENYQTEKSLLAITFAGDELPEKEVIDETKGKGFFKALIESESLPQMEIFREKKQDGLLSAVLTSDSLPEIEAEIIPRSKTPVFAGLKRLLESLNIFRKNII